MKKTVSIFIVLAFAGLCIAQKVRPKQISETELVKLRKLGVEAFNNQKNKEAIDYFTKIINAEPDYLAYCLRAETFARQNNVKAEIADYFQAVKLSNTTEFQTTELVKKYNDVAFLWGKLLVTDSYDQSIKSYSEFIEANPTSAEAYIVRGRVLQVKGLMSSKMQDAIKDYSQAIKLKPSESWFYYLRGIAYQTGGDNDLAEADYKYYLKLNPTSNLKFVKDRLKWIEESRNKQKRSPAVSPNN